MALIEDDELEREGLLSEEAVAELARMEAQGVRDRGYALKQLRRRLGIDGLITRHDAAKDLDLACAIEAEPGDASQEQNVAAVKRAMGELLRIPVVKRGAVMPDACPVAGGPATIPVGGVVEAQGAILPSATGSDLSLIHI